jgi:hypothetical protein
MKREERREKREERRYRDRERTEGRGKCKGGFVDESWNELTAKTYLLNAEGERKNFALIN